MWNFEYEDEASNLQSDINIAQRSYRIYMGYIWDKDIWDMG